MRINPTSRSSDLIVSVANVKTYLKIDNYTDDDTVISNMIDAVTREFEQATNLTVVETEFEFYLDSLSDKVEIPRPPLISIDEFYWYDDDYDEDSVDSDSYITRMFQVPEPGYIRLRSAYSWPEYTSYGDGIKIEFTAGYNEVPQDIIQAVTAEVARRYDNLVPDPEDDLFQQAIGRYKFYW